MNQEQDTSGETLEESIKEVLPTLPPVVRQYLTSGAYSKVAQGIMQRYRLHVDQGGILERELMLLIMGLSSPQEFTEHLQDEAYIPADVVHTITSDINQQVFIPMQAQMRSAAGQGAAVPPPPPAPMPHYSAPEHLPPPEQIYTPPPPPPAHLPPHPQPHQAQKGYDISYPPPAAPAPPPGPQAYAYPAGPHQAPAPVAPQGAPLPPRHVLPGAEPPVFHHPMPPPAGGALSAPPGGAPGGRPTRPDVLAPANLPTGVAPAPPSAPLPTAPERVHELPPLARPAGPRSNEGEGGAPHTRYSSDPYREPIE